MAEDNLKVRRRLWVAMLAQLRYGSSTVPEVLPGNCQDMLDHLVEREWPFKPPAPKPRHDTHDLELHHDTARDLMAKLPDWAQGCERAPGSLVGFPIFYERGKRLIYLDGRRRINHWFREDEDAMCAYWVIRE